MRGERIEAKQDARAAQKNAEGISTPQAQKLRFCQ